MMTVSQRIGAAAVAGAFILAGLGPAPAHAATAWWGIGVAATPTNLPPGGEGAINVTVSNLGDAAVTGEEGPVVVADRLPAGLHATAITGFWPGWGRGRLQAACQLASLSCIYTPDPKRGPEIEGGPIRPYQQLEVEIRVQVQEGAASGSEDEATVSGGGVPSVSWQAPITVSEASTPFGVASYSLAPEEEGGEADTQAGSHPFQLTTTLGLNTVAAPRGEELLASSPELPRDLSFVLPPGLLGNPTPFPQCTEEQFTTTPPGSNSNSCPADTAVGVAVPAAIEPSFLGPVPFKFVVPLFNLEPAPGEPARFGFTDVDVPVVLDTEVRSGSGYSVVVSAHSIDQTASFLGSQVTFWGVPGDPRHDSARGWKCLGIMGPEESCVPLKETDPPPLLSLPTSCTGPLHTTVEGDSWAHPTEVVSREYITEDNAGRRYGLDGCDRLSFDPAIGVAPDVPQASTPTGLSVNVHVPQSAGLAAEGLSESEVKDTTVALPAGVALNPAGADGLLACSEAQVGFEGVASSGADLFAPGTSAPFCPDASKVGTVEIHTPLLPDPLVGAAYLAQQNANPFGSLIAIYLVAEDRRAGVLVKLAGEVTPDQSTGQLVSTFRDTPQLPFEDLTIHFFGGSRAPLATPALCGPYTTGASIAPWSGNAASTASSTFQITSGPNGAPCRDPLPFGPTLQAGSSNIQAGGFTPFQMTMSRADGEQSLGGVELHMPPGLLGRLSTVQLCGEAQANNGSCGEGSLIGHTIVSVGLGGNPFSVETGRVYITGPYEGAPFGLSVVEPAVAGPFDLGTVVVRARIEVDPATAALTVTTDMSGPHAIPTILDGIPLEIQHVHVSIDRPGFMFNPTDCEKLQITGTLSSAQRASSEVSVPFHATNCATLGFKPQFAASTSAHTSRENGASLDTKLAFSGGMLGAQANIAKVKVQLPRQLPSRLTTLQKACPDHVFEVNPADCPQASRIGEASTTTPVLPVVLSGPVYFVSHGIAKFPELIIVLSGFGVTVEVHGETFISKSGVTSTTFNTVPDVPVGSFDLKLPEGPHSALTANGSLCDVTTIASEHKKVRIKVKGHPRTVTRRVKRRVTRALTMPTELVAQNGAVIRQETKIAVSGCAKRKGMKHLSPVFGEGNGKAKRK